MNLFNVLLLQAPVGASPAGGNAGYINILLLVALVAIFYFMMIRPQQKRQKDIQKAREAMKVGDKVITSGGIHGKIKDLGETSMLIEISYYWVDEDHGIVHVTDVVSMRRDQLKAIESMPWV